jgi:hypothetical protein
LRRVEPAAVVSDRFVIGVGALGVMRGVAGESDCRPGITDWYGQASMTSPFRKQALVVGPRREPGGRPRVQLEPTA